MKSNDKSNPVEIDETQLDDVSGGLPAVQKVRDAAARVQTPAATVQGDGSVKPGDIKGYEAWPC